MSDTPRTDALIKADWHMPVGWKDRIHEHARQLEREVAELREALTKLSNEVLGSMALFEPIARQQIGHTNYAILMQRAEEARAALKGKP